MHLFCFCNKMYNITFTTGIDKFQYVNAMRRPYCIYPLDQINYYYYYLFSIPNYMV